MKLGIFLIIVGVGDIILTLVGGVWEGFIIRGLIDIAFIIYGIKRIKKARVIKNINKDGE